jgi:hypothetical protein
MEGKFTQYKSDVVFLIPGRQFSYKFLTSWSNTLIYLHDNNISYFYTFCYTPVVSSTRNHLLGKSPFNISVTQTEDNYTTVFANEVICDKVIMIDDDMVWKPEAVEQLLNSPYDVTVAPYVLSDFETSSVRIKDKFAHKDAIKEKTEPFPIESAGLGFTVCNYNVLQKLSYPWFLVEELTRNDENGQGRGGTMGEDVYFFNKIRDNGFTPYCDPRIKVGHEKITTLTI